MKMVFLLIVVIAGTDSGSDPRWLFESLFTCNQYAYWIERQATSPRHMNPQRQQLVTAYCVPRMVADDTPVIRSHTRPRRRDDEMGGIET